MRIHLRLLIVALLGVAASCTAPAPLVTPTATPPAETPTPESPTTTLVPEPTPSATARGGSTEELSAQLLAASPEGAFEGIGVLELTVSKDSRPLWAAYSYGLRNYNLATPPSHFVAIYTWDDAGGWQELSRVELDTETAAPDYINETGSIVQVKIDPAFIWLEAHGGAGAHSGVFQLLRYDGTGLRIDLSHSNAIPGSGRVDDINGDGTPEVLFDQTDAYVFCYACGVRLMQYQAFRWDAGESRWIEVTLTPLAEDQPAGVREPANEAIVLAQAGLWKDAQAAVQQALAQAGQESGVDTMTLGWNAGLIDLHYRAREAAVEESAYPLLNHVFFGDYPPAVDILRAYTPEQIFTTDSPLIVGTPAEMWVPELSQRLIDSTTAALEVQPELAEAYFLRGWGEYLADPQSPAARTDIRKAAELRPEDSLFQASAEHLK